MSIVSGEFPRTKSKENADGVLAAEDVEELDDVDDVEVVVGAGVEEEEDVVDMLEEAGVVLVVRAAEELLVSLVAELLECGEGPSARNAPNAATAMTATTIPARTVVPTATRRSENLEQDIRVVRREMTQEHNELIGA